MKMFYIQKRNRAKDPRGIGTHRIGQKEKAKREIRYLYVLQPERWDVSLLLLLRIDASGMRPVRIVTQIFRHEDFVPATMVQE